MKKAGWIIFKKLHKWPGLIISIVLLYYGVTGIFMNHREVFSGTDVNREYLPSNYKYNNWNFAAVKGNLNLNADSIIVYGNIGIWLTDSAFIEYTSFNRGFPEGSDNRKIFDVHKSGDNHLYAASLFGLYTFDIVGDAWVRLDLNGSEERITAIESIGDTLYVTDRSFLYKGISDGVETKFETILLPTPENYENKITLFATMWQIHSGEIFGLPGKLFVDLLGLVTVFLSVTGIIYFFFPGIIRNRKRKQKSYHTIKNVNRWSLVWHNNIGSWTFVLLVVLFFSGMFLRPPMLIAIANSKVKPLPYSHLDQPNPWYDKLRDILYDEENGQMLISTSEGMYYMNPVDFKMNKFENQPPVSVMGINTFKKIDKGYYLIGSFSGLFVWHPSQKDVYNYITGDLYHEPASGRPVGDYKVTGAVFTPDDKVYIADYDRGMIPVIHKDIFPDMPLNVKEQSQLSLWNVSLEIHTGRFFQSWLKDFYILIVPLTSIFGIIVVISGYLLWRRKYRRKKV